MSKDREINLNYQGGPNIITEGSLKQKRKAEERDVSEKEAQEIWSVRETQSLTGGRPRGKYQKKTGSLWEKRRTPSWQPAKKQELPSYSHKKMDSINNLSILGNWFYPKPHWLTPWFQSYEKWIWATQTYDLKNC